MTNDFSGMADGQARYSPMCYEDGGVVDDRDRLPLLRHGLAGGGQRLQHRQGPGLDDRPPGRGLHFGGLSPPIDAQLALQEPGAEALLRTLTADLPAKNYTAVLHGTVDGRPCLVSRTGYTGEDGFELYCAPADAPALWDALTAAGALPCGLGARHTLRLEAAMPLYGHELSPSINPYEAGLGIFVKLEKPDFIGKAARERARPVSRRRVGLQTDRARHRPGGLPRVRRRAAGGRGHPPAPTAPGWGRRWPWPWWTRRTRNRAPRSRWTCGAAGWTPRWSKRPSTGGDKGKPATPAAAPSQLIL